MSEPKDQEPDDDKKKTSGEFGPQAGDDEQDHTAWVDYFGE